MSGAKVPQSIVGVISAIFSERYTHAELNNRFTFAGYPGDPHFGVNKLEKCRIWLRRANEEIGNPLVLLGRLLEEFMEDQRRWTDGIQQDRKTVLSALSAEGLTYVKGGKVMGSELSGASIKLAAQIADINFGELKSEFERAEKNLGVDPAASITAACAILESLLKTALKDLGGDLPSDQSLIPLWKAVAKKIDFIPEREGNDDIRKMFSGLFSVIDGIAALRTHIGTSHGRGRGEAAMIEARHARFAVHASHSVALFLVETLQG